MALSRLQIPADATMATPSGVATPRPLAPRAVHPVDRELKGLGLEQRASGPTNLATYPVGTLVVLLRESGSGEDIYRRA